MSPDEDEDGQVGAGTGQSGPRFADLIGDIRPLTSGVARVSPPGPVTPHSPPGRDLRAGRADRFRWPDPDQPRLAAASGVNDRQLHDLSRGEPAPEERIDLHGLRAELARRRLAQRLEAASIRHLHCVLVIHGQGRRSDDGEATLRDALPGWLSRGPAAKSVLAFAPAPDRLGGGGATLVLINRG